MRSRICLNKIEITEVHDQTKIFYFCGGSNGAASFILAIVAGKYFNNRMTWMNECIEGMYARQ